MRCPEMVPDVLRCPEMVPDVLRCPEMVPDVLTGTVSHVTLDHYGGLQCYRIMFSIDLMQFMMLVAMC